MNKRNFFIKLFLLFLKKHNIYTYYVFNLKNDYRANNDFFLTCPIQDFIFHAFTWSRCNKKIKWSHLHSEWEELVNKYAKEYEKIKGKKDLTYTISYSFDGEFSEYGFI